MLVNRALNLIWIHTPKTGGSSIYEALRPLDEGVQYNGPGGPLRSHIGRASDEAWIDTAHIPWWRLKRVMSEYRWEMNHEFPPLYFGVVRNPWDWAHSHWKWGHIRRAKKPMSFLKWLPTLEGDRNSQWWRVSATREHYKPELTIYQYEDIILGPGWLAVSSEINRRCEIMGWPQIPYELPWEKRTGDVGDYLAEYNYDSAYVVRQLFLADIAHFGYANAGPDAML
jgi:hypothetical protein